MFFLEYGVISQKFFAPFSVVGFTERIVPLFTYMFLHGGFFHVFFNVYFLFIFGDNVEDRLGHVRYLIFYLLAGIISGIVQIIIFSTSAYPLIGASGAVAGVMGAYMLFFPRATVKTLVIIIIFITVIDIPAIIFLGFWFLIQFFNGTASLGLTGGGTAWWAHIGGFSFGLIYALYFMSKRNSEV
jgi:membrane associated rhomboid family serine protease